ncbi:MAG: lipopolysaccharide biosynthesis protein [Candidatus Paceibacteria bacterium]
MPASFLPFTEQIKHKWNDSLYRNSIFLIMTMAAMAGFGFIFWLINAKLFSAQDIGIATAIIPTTTMIAIGSLFGLDSSIVRFLNSKEHKSQFVRSAFFLITLMSIIGSIVFGLFSYIFSPTISDFFANNTNYFVFVGLTVFTAINLLADAIYLANKRTVFTFIVTTTHSFLRMLFPFLFIHYGAAGILLAAMSAQIVGLFLNLFVLQRTWQYFESVSISFASLGGIWKFTTHNYLAGLLNLLPYSIVPIIIIDSIGEAESAYFYIVTMISNLMYVIPNATTQSLFAEGSHNEANIFTELKKSIMFISIFIIPAILIIYFSADFLLGFFGEDYAQSGANLLIMLSLVTIPYSVIIIAKAIFKVTKKTHYLLFCAALVAGLEISLVYYFIGFGLIGIGYAFLSSNLLVAGIASLLAVRALKTSDK